METKELSVVDLLRVGDDEMDKGSHRTGLEEPHNPGYRRKPRDTVLITDTRHWSCLFHPSYEPDGWVGKEGERIHK